MVFLLLGVKKYLWSCPLFSWPIVQGANNLLFCFNKCVEAGWPINVVVHVCECVCICIINNDSC